MITKLSVNGLQVTFIHNTETDWHWSKELEPISWILQHQQKYIAWKVHICILILDASNRLRIKMRIFLENAYLSRSELRRRYCKFQFIFDLLLLSFKTNPEIEIKMHFKVLETQMLINCYRSDSKVAKIKSISTSSIILKWKISTSE